MARLLRNLSFFRQSLLSQSIFMQGVRNGLVGASTHICHFASKGKRKSSSDESDSGEENLSKKDLALKQALDQITKSFGKGSIMWLGRSVCPKQVPVVSTGSLALDIALGVGGLPKGRVIEIYGPEASGKTTLALHVIAEAQKQGGYCCFVDAEHALDPALAEAIGVNTGNLLVSQPDCGEQALGLVDTLIRSGSVDVVVVDSDCTATTTWLQPDSIAPQRSSRHVWEPLQCNHVVVAVQSFSSSQVKVAALVPKSELEGEMGDPHMAMQARLMSQALRKLSHSLSLSQTVLIFINQVRAKLSTFSGFGGPQEVTCGGNALKFYASVRLNIKRVGNVIKGEQTIGSQVAVKIVKNKLAPPFRTAEFELEFGKGICRESELIQLGLKHKFISKMGSAYYGMNNQTFHGKDALKQYLAKDISAREELIMKLREKLLHDVGNKDAAGTETVNGYPVEVVSTDTTDDEVVATAAEV